MPRTIKKGSPGYETRGCGECGGEGLTMRCGNGAHDRPEPVTCPRCGGLGEASVFVYAVREIQECNERRQPYDPQ